MRVLAFLVYNTGCQSIRLVVFLALILFQESQETPLMMAAKKGIVGIVKKLIKHGASVNLTNKVNQVLLCALEFGRKTGT